jgi:formate/nitrite transporter FocA (FNT family)
MGDTDVLDAAEAFDQLEVERVKMQDPASVHFFLLILCNILL